ncbi:nitroreductase family protein [Sinorhizobium sp. RAC02]|uniref:nitroreductase family protein n=1 Tax=Sinorhizobium sp. RAC02 TaxID=1842534 RepID=UPI00083DA12E|nr:nitroreductase family protein [Sinorhizobium sp. RAC02]AOF89105.1 NAD(P)H-flavin oxidoreductase [Sinorhizobium sp. RAC02]
MTHPTGRIADHTIAPLFLDRWSPRAFTGEAMPQATLLSLFEAARWAPSAANGQPWRFVYGHRGTEAFETIYNTLDEGNRRWADKASVLAVIISQTHRKNADGEMRPAYTHAFDTGAAWAYLALEATRAGYHAHGMGGIDREKAMQVLGVPEGFRVEAGLAIGKIAPKETLPEDLMKREVPSTRKPVAEFISEGTFTA